MDSLLLIKSVSEILGIKDVALVSLVNATETRQIVVSCELEMRDLIMKYMTDRTETQMLFPSVVNDILATRDKSSLEVRINGVKDGVYQTEIYDRLTQKSFPIRCSDGIFMSVACKIVCSRMLSKRRLRQKTTRWLPICGMNSIKDIIIRTNERGKIFFCA